MPHKKMDELDEPTFEQIVVQHHASLTGLASIVLYLTRLAIDRQTAGGDPVESARTAVMKHALATLQEPDAIILVAAYVEKFFEFVSEQSKTKTADIPQVRNPRGLN